MSRRALPWVAGGLAAAALVALLWWSAAERDGGGPGADGTEELQPGEPASFTLYFPGPGGLLHPEERELAAADGPGDGATREVARTLVLALLDGPQSDRLVAPFPPEVGLLDLYLGPDGVAFVDLGGVGGDGPQDGEAGETADEATDGGEAGDEGGGGARLAKPPGGGSREEMQRVYSVVQTLGANLPGISRVVLLWNGRQLPTFAGHLDTSRPLEPRGDLVAAPKGDPPAPAGQAGGSAS